MSYILDALKKMEHEKNRKNLGSGKGNIAGSLFENERPRPAGKSGWKIVLAVVIAIIVTFGITWKFLAYQKNYAVMPSRPAPSPAQVPMQRNEVLLPSSPLKSTVSIPLPAVTPASRPAPVVQVAKPPLSALVTDPVEEEAATILPQQELRKRHKDRKEMPASATQIMTPPADIKLSGIAYQEERRARRAVVNGFLVQEGAVVSGAVITDIYQDRVRFLQAGRIFELTLTSSGAAALGK